MPIASYLVYPLEGRVEELQASLAAMEGCEVIPSTNADVLILLTETADWEADKALHRELSQCAALQCVVLVMGEVDGELASSVEGLDTSSLSFGGVV